MANLEKYKDRAKKFELKEQWAKAVEEYVQAIEEMEGGPEIPDAELVLYNKAGDLYQKIGQASNAVAYYERAVDKYQEIGLANNAIALCNKVLRLAPGRSGTYLKLGMLFASKGFGAEAKTNLLEYADRMQKAGQLEEAFKALKKFAEMTPGQDDIWSVLAQQARAAARTPDQKEQVEKLLGEFEAKDRTAQHRKSRASRSMITGEELPPEPPSKKGELIFLDLDEPPRRGSAATPAPKAAAPAPAPPARKAPPPPPPPPRAKPAPPPAARPAPAPAPEEPEIEKLEIEPTSLVPEAEAPLEIVPTSLVEEEPEAPPLPMLDIESTSLAEPEAAPVEELAAEEAAPAEEPALEEPLELEPAVLPEAEAEPAPEGESGAPGELEIEEPAAAEAGAADLNFMELEETPAEEAPVEEAESPVAGLPMLEGEEGAAVEEVPADEELPPAEEPGAAVEEAPAAEMELSFLDMGEAPAPPTVEELEARIAADAADWEAHRLLAEALTESGDRERAFAEFDTAIEGQEQAGDLDAAYAVTEEVLRLDPNSVRYHQKRVELSYRQGDRLRLAGAYLELADALLRSGQADKAVAVYQRVLEHDPANERARSAVETLAPPAAAEPAPQPVAATPAGGFVDLGAMLLDEQGPKDTRMRIEDEEPSGDEQKDFQTMLAAFKKGVEANVEEEDFQSHYDLGVAYKEMGLLDEAIAEFQKALRGAEGRLKASEALGLCFFEKGQFTVAETILRRALELPATGDAERVGLLYWLGRTQEELGKSPDALHSYNRVFAVDITFQDVSHRVKTLSRAGA